MPSTGEEEMREGQGWPNVQSVSEAEEMEADPQVGVSISRRNPEDSQGYLVLTYLHPQPQSSSPVPPHDGSHRETPGSLT